MDKLNRNVAYKQNSKHIFKLLSVSLLIIVIAAAASYIYFWQYDQINQLNKRIDDLTTQLNQSKNSKTTITDTYISAKSVSIKLFSPQSDAKITSPLIIMGQVPGSWSFEASFPIKLKNSTGVTVAEGTGQIIGDWMTTELVPFSAQLTWVSTESGVGTLVLQKDNPSGLAQNDDSVTIPIQF